jgi:hypothetical protein
MVPTTWSNEVLMMSSVSSVVQAPAIHFLAPGTHMVWSGTYNSVKVL